MKRFSLPLGTRHKLTVPYQAKWDSDNPLVKVMNGWVYAEKDALFPNSIATITATEVGGSRSEQFKATIVNWSANALQLELVKRFEINYNITQHGNKLYAARRNTGLDLFESTDGLETLTKVSTLPEPLEVAPMLITPHGYFIFTHNKIYRSIDLSSWTLSTTVEPYAIKHGFDFYYDQASDTTYVYSGEYNTHNHLRHKVHRGTITHTSERWDVVLDVKSRNELEADKLAYPAGWHIHSTIVDKSSGYLWVLIGDHDNESMIMYSTDNGNTFEELSRGSQEWRSISMWFTTGYIYWNMDAGKKQKVFRIPRSWVGTKTPYEINRYKETVADLENGSLWYHMWIKDIEGNDVVLHTAAAEGYRRDYNARVFTMRENADGSVTNEEVLLVVGTNPENYHAFLQMEPFAQDSTGFIYLSGRGTEWGTTHKYRLIEKGTNKLYRFVKPRF